MMFPDWPFPRLCFVGPMLGRYAGWVPSQGEILARLFYEAGYQVCLTSPVKNRYLRLVDGMRSLIAWRNQIDLVVLMVFSGPAFIHVDMLSFLAQRLGKPVIFWLHGGNLPDFSRQSAAWFRRVMGRGVKTVSPSAYLASQIDWSGPVEVIPNVLNLNSYPFRLRRELAPRLLWMRTFHEIYNPCLAIEALAHLRMKWPAATLTMAGQDKGMLAMVREKAAAVGVSAAVRFPGFLEMDAKLQAFAEHDIYLNTNRVDNMPVSILEAVACGLPVVATNIGGIPYLLEQERTGLLVDDNHPAQMADAVDRLLTEPGLVARLSTEGRLLAETSGWERVRMCWETLFDQMRQDGSLR